MNDNIILEFLKEYKELDELCKQILSSDRGISEYIDEMSRESQGYRISGWDMDYKKLKKLRWIRNRLVHETGSFESDLVNVEDIKWLQVFYHRIINCTDPFSLLHQSVNTNGKTAIKEYKVSSFSSSPPAGKRNSSDRNIILAGIILAGAVLIGIVVFCIILSVVGKYINI